MTLSVADRVLETSTTMGTGTLNLLGPVTGFRRFVSGVASGSNVPYVIDDGSDWEIGIGIITDATPDTLARTTVIASSNSNSLVDWGPGTRNVRLAPLASLVMQRDEKLNDTIGYGTGGGTANAQTITLLPAPLGYTLGMKVLYKPSVANTSAFTINVGGQGAKNVKMPDGSDPIANAVLTTGIYFLVYNGTNLVLLNAEAPPIVDNAGLPNTQDFRLTLTTGVPVTTANVTAATTLYCTPYKGTNISLYDGVSAWIIRSSAQFSIALGTLTADRMHDVFCYDNAGTPTLEILPWTNNTTRATALVYQNGILVKSGATTRRYLGSFLTTTTTTTEDSSSNRFLYNYYNRVSKQMSATEAAASWAYSVATFRQLNNSTANQLNFIVGVAEDCVQADIIGIGAGNSAAGPQTVYVGIGLDSVTVNSGIGGMLRISNGWFMSSSVKYAGIPAVGKHYLAAIEKGAGADTQTWRSDGGGIVGTIFA